MTHQHRDLKHCVRKSRFTWHLLYVSLTLAVKTNVTTIAGNKLRSSDGTTKGTKPGKQYKLKYQMRRTSLISNMLLVINDFHTSVSCIARIVAMEGAILTDPSKSRQGDRLF